VNRTEDQLGQMLGQAWDMPYGRGQIAAVEEIIRHADAQGFAGVQYAARILAQTAYIYGGEPAKVFVPFAWCLSVHDKGEADPHHDSSLLWNFKAISHALLKFPEVPLDRVLAVLDDMERRYRAAGHTMNPVHMCRAKVAHHVGDDALAAEQYRLWCAAPRGEMADCAGCEPTAKIVFLTDDDRDDDAIALARPVLGGQLTCHEQPASILTGLLFSYVRTGRLAEAADAHRTAYRQMRVHRADLSDIATHVTFCALTGNEARAVELLTRHRPWLDEAPSPSAEMWFAASAALALRRAGDSGHAELAERALAIAARFDARNGTTRVSERIRQRISAEPLVDHLPLTAARHVERATAAAAAPASPPLPTTPEDLVAHARDRSRLHDIAGADAAWARFDELLPEPTGDLLAKRLDVRAIHAARAKDFETAQALWAEAVALYETEGDLVRVNQTRLRLGTVLCLGGRVEEGRALIAQGAEDVAGADDEQRCITLVRLAHAHASAHQHDEAVAAARRAHDLAEGVDVALRADVALSCAEMVAPVDLAEGRRAAELAIELFTPLDAPNAVASAELILARVRATEGDLKAGLDTLATTADDPSLRARVALMRGALNTDLGDPGAAADAYGEASVSFAAAGMPEAAAYAAVDYAGACVDADRPEQAADAAEEAIPVMEDLDEQNAARAKYVLALAHRDLAQPDHALPLLAEVAEYYRTHEFWPALGQALGVSADLLDQLDRDADAAAAYEDAATAFTHADEIERALHNHRRAALSWHWAGDPRSLTALTTAESHPVDPEVPGVHWELAMLGYDGARILDAAGRTPEALTRAESAITHFTAIDEPHLAAMATTLQGRLLRDLNRPTEAKRSLESALAALPDDHPQRKEVLTLLESL
jgi:tetratricopeptide (TPR) repeat protein